MRASTMPALRGQRGIELVGFLRLTAVMGVFILASLTAVDSNCDWGNKTLHYLQTVGLDKPYNAFIPSLCKLQRLPNGKTFRIVTCRQLSKHRTEVNVHPSGNSVIFTKI